MFKHVFETNDHDLFLKIMTFVNSGAQIAAAVAPIGSPAANVASVVAAVTAPPAPPANAISVVPAAPLPPPPPVVAPPAPPAPPAAPVVQHGPAPEGWTIDHVRGAATTLAQTPAKGGPGKVKEIFAQFGAKKIDEVDPARWPELYALLTA